jgi:hypothetical protein
MFKDGVYSSFAVLRRIWASLLGKSRPIERWQIPVFQQTLMKASFSNDALRLQPALLEHQGMQEDQKQM